MIMFGGRGGWKKVRSAAGGGEEEEEEERDEAREIPAELSAVQDYNLSPFFNPPSFARAYQSRPRGLSDTVKQPTAENERDNSAESNLHRDTSR